MVIISPSALVARITSVFRLFVKVASAAALVTASAAISDAKDASALALVTASVAISEDNEVSAAALVAASAAKASAAAVVLASTYVLTDFTLEYFTSDAPSATTLVLLLIKSSFKASAAVALVTSVAILVAKAPSALVALITSAFKLEVNVASAAALVAASAVKFAAIVFSALVARITSAAKALDPAVILEST